MTISNNMSIKTKIISIITLVVVLALTGFFYFRFYFVFGEGVKAGDLNQVMYKGYVFKTYEGRLIQSGLRPMVWNPTFSSSLLKTGNLLIP